MQRFWILFLALATGTILLCNCAPTGVGDPCEPEVQPDEWASGEIALETSSLQCRTRICMHYNGNDFCTKRCDSDADCNATGVEEGPGDGDQPSAFCEAEVTVGSPGMLGLYCVPNRAHNPATE